MVRHVLGISGGKDSAALALFLKERHPELDIEYYTCDTGKELSETYALIDRLESGLGKKITRLVAIEPQKETPYKTPFDHFLAEYGGYLPSAQARWCTKKMKLEPFEKYIGELPTISYVGIRGDEDREGYISKKPNVQSIFPFRKNIWSEDVVRLVLGPKNLLTLVEHSEYVVLSNPKFLEVASKPVGPNFTLKQKLNTLLEINVKSFNRVVHSILKTTSYPVGMLDEFPLLDNEDNLGIEDIFSILESSGVGKPEYYNRLTYQVEIDDELKTGYYSRSRSGCFFCFFQQKIEWVWLFENHKELYYKAMEYEKEGYTWMESESLEELSHPERLASIKKEHYLKLNRLAQKRTSDSWKEEVLAAEGNGCASCFI